MTFLTVIAFLGSTFIIAVVVELIRRGRLKEKYAILWLLSGIVMVAVSLARPLWDRLSLAVGVYYPPSFLFLAAIVFLILINLHYSMVISGLTDRSNRLAQEIALLKTEIARWGNETERDRGAAADTR